LAQSPKHLNNYKTDRQKFAGLFCVANEHNQCADSENELLELGQLFLLDYP